MASSVDIFDIVLSFDTTGSMSSCLDAVRKRMREIMRKLKSDIPGIRMGVIAHGDYDTNHIYVIKYENLTDNVERLCRFVESAKGTGRGVVHRNLDEAYELALHYARCEMNWRNDSNRVLVIIGDCRPHEKDYILNEEQIDWTEEIILLRDMNVKINAVKCMDRDYSESFYQKIASTTFGHFVSLNDIKKIENVLMSICYREAGLGMKMSPYVLSTSPATTAEQMDVTEPAASTSARDEPVEEDSDTESDSDDQNEKFGMKCPMCNVVKPPNEFPSTTVSEDCEHAPLECLRCVVKHVTETGTCPGVACIVEVDPQCKVIEVFKAKLDRMFVDYKKVLEQRTKMLKPGGDLISVSTINGDTEWFPYKANLNVFELKREIGKKLGLKVEQQRLIYNDKNLKDNARLSDYGIQSSANISLIMPLYCVPGHLDHVVFDLSWEFPPTNPDFLDATCMAFEKEEFIQVIDWTHSSNEYYLKNSVKHTEENLTGPGAKTGHQKIHVYLKKVPWNITHLYFTLSSWRSPSLSAFRNPSLTFYEASSENVNLCETTITHALNSQAVIMCFAVRAGTKWEIFECGAGSLVSGNAKSYNPIRARIAELIKSEL